MDNDVVKDNDKEKYSILYELKKLLWELDNLVGKESYNADSDIIVFAYKVRSFLYQHEELQNIVKDKVNNYPNYYNQISKSETITKLNDLNTSFNNIKDIYIDNKRITSLLLLPKFKSYSKSYKDKNGLFEFYEQFNNVHNTDLEKMYELFYTTFKDNNFFISLDFYTITNINIIEEYMNSKVTNLKHYCTLWFKSIIREIITFLTEIYSESDEATSIEEIFNKKEQKKRFINILKHHGKKIPLIYYILRIESQNIKELNWDEMLKKYPSGCAPSTHHEAVRDFNRIVFETDEANFVNLYNNFQKKDIYKKWFIEFIQEKNFINLYTRNDKEEIKHMIDNVKKLNNKDGQKVRFQNDI